MIIKLCIIGVTVLIVSIIFTGIFECSEKQISRKTFWKAVLITLKIGTSKVLSSVCITLLTVVFSAFLLSIFIKPELQDVMPAFYYDGTYSEFNTEEKTAEIINTILEDAEDHKALDMESAYYDIAYAYFSSGNYDLAIGSLEICYDANPCWKYAYDIGVSYGYMMEYQASAKYLKKALDLNPPAYDRAAILDTVTMMENYFSIWITSLFQ